MQEKKKILLAEMKCAGVAVLCLLLASCATPSRAETGPSTDLDNWIQSPRVFFADMSSEIPKSEYAELEKDERRRGLDALRDAEAVAITRERVLKDFPAAAARLPEVETYTLFRAVTDGGNGVFSVFRKDVRLLVDYLQMGGCGAAERTALLVASGTKVDRVYGGCSGAK